MSTSRFTPPKTSNLVIGRCSDCRRVVRTEIEHRPSDLTHPGMLGASAHAVLKFGRVGGFFMHETSGTWLVQCSRFPGGCSPDQLGGMMEFKRVKHALRKTAPTKCGGQCRGAKGPSCDCECGGDNHGANHGG